MSTTPDQPPTVPLDADPADVLEQAAEAAPDAFEHAGADALDLREADPADLLDQARVVPVDDEERDPA